MQPLKGHEFARELKTNAGTGVTFPGGYRLFLVMTDGECLCWACVKENAAQIRLAAMTKARDGWRPLAFDVNWESPDLYCANCNEQIESEYGNG